MTILHSLVGLHERLVADGTAPAFGFSRENISYAVVLSPDGEAVDVQDLRDTSGRTSRPSRRVVPRPVKRTGQPVPNFLWDKTAFALGVKRDTGTSEPVCVVGEHAAFKDFHRRMLATCEDEAALAFLRFLDRWRAEDFENLRYAADMLDANIVFRLDGAALSFLHERPFVQDIWLHHLVEEAGAQGLCLVTGERAAIARLHPSVKGVGGAQSSGASLVSFDKDAFKSFGKERGANAPVSERAAFAYTASLNTLLERDSRRRIQIGDATTVFWAEAAGDDPRADAGEDLFSLLLAPPPDAEKTAEVADKLTAVAQGRPLAEVDPHVDEEIPFCVLGLAPNAARVSIRFWHRNTIGELARRIAEHWRDLRLEPAPWPPPAVWRLLKETAVQGKARNIPPTLGGALMRAILGGGRYPRSLLAAVVGRMRADKNVTGMRAAICKACLSRDHRMGFEEEDVPVGLNREERSPAYRLGRLFALYESVQRAALGRNVNATIKDRFFGAASATPASVFPLLERNSANHLASLRKGEKGGLAHWFDGEIDEILAGMDTAFPRSLRLEDQGRFAIGYHHQRETKRKVESEDDGSDASAAAVESPSLSGDEDQR